jgi:hypothetical protein
MHDPFPLSCNLSLSHMQVVVTQPIGLVHYPGVAEGLYAACSSGIAISIL